MVFLFSKQTENKNRIDRLFFMKIHRQTIPGKFSILFGSNYCCFQEKHSFMLLNFVN